MEKEPSAPPRGLYFFGNSKADSLRRLTEKVERGGAPGSFYV
jgi:hypothetical protein